MWRSQLGLFIERTHRKHSFYDPHNRDYKHVVKRELRMLTWQKHHSQGYFDAIRSVHMHVFVCVCVLRVSMHICVHQDVVIFG